MSRRDDTVTLQQIREHANQAVAFADSHRREELDGTSMFFHATVRLITVVGEAVKRLSPELRAANPHVPWAAIAGMRDVLVHDYEHIRAGVLWEALRSHLPALLAAVEPMLAAVPPPPPDLEGPVPPPERLDTDDF